MAGNFFSGLFNSNKRPLPKTVRNYETDDKPSFFENMINFPTFVAIGAVLVAVIVISVIAVGSSQNAFTQFVDASSKNFDCSSFDYHITAKLNADTHMEYDGTVEFDLDKQNLVSAYHAVYDEYEYDAVTYMNGSNSYHGNYYDGKWTITDNTEKVLDFLDFYRDYRNHSFDAGAAVRFTNSTQKFNASQLEASFEKIYSELSSARGMNNVMHITSSNNENGTKITMKPDLYEVMRVVMENSGSAFVSANAYSEFCDKAKAAEKNLKNADAVLSYVIDKKGYLTDITLDYKINSDHYVIEAQMSNFEKATAKIPDGFFTAAGISD